MSAVKLFTAAALLLAAPAMARTDIAGCVSSDTVVKPTGGGTPYASRIWYVPGTGEICEFLDCGGGRAPPKTNVPGCPSYEGTETYSPSYLDLQTSEAAAPTTTEVPAKTTKKDSYEATITDAPKTDKVKTTLSTAVAESESESESAVQSANGTVVTAAPAYSTPASGSGSGSGSSSGAASTPTASTAGASSMSAGSALVALVAGAAVYAML